MLGAQLGDDAGEKEAKIGKQRNRESGSTVTETVDHAGLNCKHAWCAVCSSPYPMRHPCICAKGLGTSIL